MIQNLFASLLVSIALFCSGELLAYPLTPTPGMTSGGLCDEIDPDFVDHVYPESIPYCERNVSTALKQEIYAAYGIPYEEHSQYTIDHLIPLAIGGSNEPANLWPEHRALKATRPALEMRLYLQLRDGKITQQQAIHQVLWEKFHPPVCELEP